MDLFFRKDFSASFFCALAILQFLFQKGVYLCLYVPSLEGMPCCMANFSVDMKFSYSILGEDWDEMSTEVLMLDKTEEYRSQFAFARFGFTLLVVRCDGW